MRTQNGGENQYSLPFSRKVFNAANMLANGYPKDALRQLEGVPDGVSVDGVTAGQLRKRIREKLPTEG